MVYGDSDDKLGVVKVAAYSDRLSIKSQETLKVFVSCEEGRDYKAETVRLICGDENPRGPGYKAISVEMGLTESFSGRHQEIHAGSYIVIESKQVLEDIADFTAQAFIFPTIPDRGEQGLITKWCTSEQKGVCSFHQRERLHKLKGRRWEWCDARSVGQRATVAKRMVLRRGDL